MMSPPSASILGVRRTESRSLGSGRRTPPLSGSQPSLRGCSQRPFIHPSVSDARGEICRACGQMSGAVGLQHHRHNLPRGNEVGHQIRDMWPLFLPFSPWHWEVGRSWFSLQLWAILETQKYQLLTGSYIAFWADCLGSSLGF